MRLNKVQRRWLFEKIIPQGLKVFSESPDISQIQKAEMPAAKAGSLALGKLSDLKVAAPSQWLDLVPAERVFAEMR
jgi:hypothetical protein